MVISSLLSLPNTISVVTFSNSKIYTPGSTPVPQLPYTEPYVLLLKSLSPRTLSIHIASVNIGVPPNTYIYTYICDRRLKRQTSFNPKSFVACCHLRHLMQQLSEQVSLSYLDLYLIRSQSPQGCILPQIHHHSQQRYTPRLNQR